MTLMKTFDSTDEPLPDLLKHIDENRLQLPDFQRGWVWDDDRIRSLLASVSLTYPIGAVMLLETRENSAGFQARPVEGASQESTIDPEELILDGQQRLTSLYQTLVRKSPVETTDSRRKKIQRLYFLDCNKALDPNSDREESIVSVPHDGIIKTFRGETDKDYSSLEKQCQAEMFPLTALLDEIERNNWQKEYLRQAGDAEAVMERLERWNSFYELVVRRFQEYRVPVIRMSAATPREAVCQVFEKVNTGGVPLNVFEILTAIYASKKFRLGDDWKARITRLKENRILDEVKSTEFLQAVALVVTWSKVNRGDVTAGIGCKRKDILERVTLEDYGEWADRVTVGFERAGKLLHALKIFSAKDVPYGTQLVPLSATMALLGEKADNEGTRSKLARWLWCGVFGELYSGTTETRFARDLPELLSWIEGGPEPSTVSEAYFDRNRLVTLRTRNSAAYKGLHALTIQDGAQDFRTGITIDDQVYFDESIDIHHIFPQKWCRDHGIPAVRCDTIVNKAPLSARTNRIIGRNAPSAYLSRIQRGAEITDQRMDAILRSQAVDPEALRSNDFDRFYSAREDELLRRIEHAMGKPVVRDVVDDGIEPVIDYEDIPVSDSDTILTIGSLGKEVWEGIDPGEYVNRERESWNG